ncbi:OmpA family protein [Aurantimonas aggregata]|uniref:OmpA family protein n=1 Tax=Aurantimonas aggregata TaxID=2047720 RepID=UPI00194490B9|nr:OmpA family protein [Aurantimonas aggregata]
MPNLKRTGRFVGVAALAASTALSGPLAAYAQDAAPYRLAQAEDPAAVIVPDVAEPEAAVVEEPAPAPEPEAPAVEEPAPAPEAAPAEEPAPEPAPEPDVPAEVPAVEEPPVEEPAAEATPVEEPAAEAPVAEPAVEAPVEEPAAEAAPVEEPAAPAEEPAAEAAPEPAPEPEAAPAAEAPPAQEAPVAEEAPATAPAEPAPAAEEAAPAEAAPAAAPETLEAPAEAPESEPAPATDGAAPTEAAPAELAPEGAAPAEAVPATPEAAAPAEAPATPADAAAPAAAEAAAPIAPPPAPQAAEPVSVEIQNEPVPEGGVSQSDARVQQLAEPVEVRSARSEPGERIEAPAGSTSINNSSVTNNTVVNNTTTNTNNTVVQQQAPLPPGAEVVERVGGRDILSIVGAGVAGAVVGGAAGYFIRGNDDDRIAVDSQERYYERLPRERTRETVVRDNGVQIVTITNRYGDVIQRSRVMPDGREDVLFYDPYERNYDDGDYYEDPAAGLDPIDLLIPMDEYIVDPREPDEDLYYRTIVAPPVETVERIYSVDEVRRSERIRDKVRRIDLSTINFAFGSDAIPQEQVPNLQALADAIARVIEQNPAETFLIEGHTDAVGSDLANLALSDRRAAGVATALTDYFDVPPENLVTQGYGEQYLKVDTESENAENRRVTVRRITPLVKPVESAAR